ncbi:pentapeptide repeat-containing protein [Cohaesibacter celericrescens]|nr:pentapeptide repeat-containing protein [Cohaesibacter celericrescens]
MISSKLLPNAQDLEQVQSDRDTWIEYLGNMRAEDANWRPVLAGAEFIDQVFRRYDFRNANLIGANFEGATLTQSRFNDANLENANFRNADLKGVNFEGANLRTADLRGAVDYEEVSFSNTILTGAKLPGHLQPDNELFKGAIFEDLGETHGLEFMKPNWKRIMEEEPNYEEDLGLAAIKHSANPNENQGMAGNEEHEDRVKSLEDLLAQVDDKIVLLESVFKKADTRLSRSETTQRSFEQTVSKANQLTSDFEATHAEIEHIIEGAKSKASDSFLATMRPELDAAKAEVKVDGIMGTAHEAWARKQRNHWVAFGIGAFVFIASILTLLIVGVRFEDAIAEFVRAMSVVEVPSNNAQTTSMTSIFGRLAAITIPVAAIAWILRLISRFTLQNLTLANDAGQRKICIDTYAKLVGTEGALDEKDRAIMLNSIFRPLPGSQQEDISPPNLLDLVSRKGD